MSMNYIGKFFSNFKEFYNEINTATLTGAIDVIVVEQPDGSFNCSPFHVRFGKLGVLRSREKVVDIEINGEPVDIHMKLGESGEAFFVEELEDDENELPEHLATSPIPVSEFENIFTSQGRRRSFDLTQETTNLENEVNDYTKRRNTGDIENISRTKNRERDFIKRQIGLGNIGIGENSTEDVTLAIQGNKPNFDENDANETIFQMDSLDDKPDKTVSTNNNNNNKTNNKIEETVSGNESRSSKKKRRKTKKKNASRKSSNNQMTTNVIELSTISTTQQQQHQQQQNDSTTTATDPSSIESNSSETELKDTQINDGKPAESLSSSSSTRKIIDPDFHFFSDTELTTNNLNDPRTNSPIEIESVQSDSEFEMKNRKGNHENTSQSWEWGGFPTNSSITTPPLTTITTTVTDEMLQMKNQQQQEQQLLQQPQQDKSMISNMFSFMKKSHHNDGIYLSDIHSMDPEVAALYFSKINNKTQDADMDCESGNGTSLAQSPNSAEGCKSIDSDFEEHIKGSRYVSDISISLCGWDIEPDIQRFSEHLVTFSDFCNNPALLDNPNLVVSIRGKYYNWKVAGPIISSFMIFNRPLLQSSIDQLCNMYMPPKQQQKQQESRSWWSWRRSKTASREQTPNVDLPKSTKDDSDDKETTSIEIPEEQLNAIEKINDEKDYNVVSSSPSSDKYKKTLRLSSKQIALLNLRNGMNEVAFSVTTAYQGTTRCTCHLYKWKWDDKIVISDIDGTITKSDVLGHILPIMGKDWAQSGVAQLFNKIKDNGYKLLYLSARAIGQARITRDYLKSIKQGDLTMPDGPILLNPTSLITAFHREVIEKKPEQFKISCMSDIKALFPPDSEPFYAGYGNRINDVWAYRAVGIPIMRIFTINPKGELKHELTQTFQSTYTNMTDYVDQLFPAVIEQSNDYSQFTYWRDPLPVVDELSELP